MGVRVAGTDTTAAAGDGVAVDGMMGSGVAATTGVTTTMGVPAGTPAAGVAVFLMGASAGGCGAGEELDGGPTAIPTGAAVGTAVGSGRGVTPVVPGRSRTPVRADRTAPLGRVPADELVGRALAAIDWLPPNGTAVVMRAGPPETRVGTSRAVPLVAVTDRPGTRPDLGATGECECCTATACLPPPGEAVLFGIAGELIVERVGAPVGAGNRAEAAL